MNMSVLMVKIPLKKPTACTDSTSKHCSIHLMDNHTPNLRASSNQAQSAKVRRRSLNISHYNAIHTAISNLARIDDFDLEELGYGFFSDVFKVTHKQTGHVMVLKRNKDTNSKMNILREVQLMNRLSHPNILRFNGVCVHEGQLHALLEYINGGDLDQLISSKEVILTWKQRTQLGLDLSDGVRYLHSVGLFHRDLSVKNCLIRITDLGSEKQYTGIVSDLGLAEKIPSTIEEKKQLSLVGTPYIMAPEMLHQKPYDEKVDVFAFGLLLCQLIALISNDPNELPRSRDFGLARDLFENIIATPNETSANSSTSLPPPGDFLQLAYDCCEFSPSLRPSFSEIVSRLEKQIASFKRKQVARSSSVRDKAELTVSRQKTEVFAKPGDDCDIDSNSASSTTGQQRSRSSSSSSARLSRSFSDVSRELLIQTASMMTSANGNDIGYTNPFSTLKHLNSGKIKLTDEPSMALLKMTFDLTTLDGLEATWNKSAEKSPIKRRSKSVISVNGPLKLDLRTSKIRSRSRPSSSHLSDSGENNVFRSPRTSSSDQSLHRHESDYVRARYRAMFLSPMGNNFTARWCTRHKSCHETIENRRQSLATALSLFSNDVDDMPHSISMPDLSRIKTLFNSILPSDVERLKYPLTKVDKRCGRSSTYNELAHRPSKEPIVEESEADLVQLECRQSSLTTRELGCEKLSIETPPANECDRNMDAFQQSGNDGNACDRSTSEVGGTKTIGSLSFSSSSSSNCSSSNLAVSLQSGEVTQQRRLMKASLKTNLHHSSFKSPVQRNSSPTESLSTNSNNRDSGYEETVSDEHNLPGVSSPYDCHHPLFWKIPEEASTFRSMHV